MILECDCIHPIQSLYFVYRFGEVRASIEGGTHVRTYIIECSPYDTVLLGEKPSNTEDAIGNNEGNHKYECRISRWISFHVSSGELAKCSKEATTCPNNCLLELL